MLEYEKKLHLDEKWERMQQINWYRFIYKIPFYILEFAFAYIILKLILSFILDLHPWNMTGVWRTIMNIPITKADIIYVIGGMILYLYGKTYLSTVIYQNHTVKNEAGNPIKMLYNGCYAHRRHPMYGGFVICAASILFSLRSVIGMIIVAVVIVFQHINAYWEEQRVLIPMFGEQYLQYKKSVPFMLFRYWEWCLLALIMVLNIVGLLI